MCDFLCVYGSMCIRRHVCMCKRNIYRERTREKRKEGRNEEKKEGRKGGRKRETEGVREVEGDWYYFNVQSVSFSLRSQHTY